MSVPDAVEKVEQQATLFQPRLNRFALLKLKVETVAESRVLRVIRNHAFEGVASALPPFLSFAGVPMTVELGDYDDSLNLPDGSADAHLAWLDYERYGRLTDDELSAWIVARLAALRAATSGPIVVANAPDPGERYATVNRAITEWAAKAASAYVLRLGEIAEAQGDAFFDEARAAVTGTRYAERAQLEAARVLAFELLAGCFAPPIKALAVDLDNTLYEGVLGEDGPEGVALTAGHAALQGEVARWAAQGVLVAVLSRNEPADVERLFELRSDFPLARTDVTDWRVSWGRKSEALAAAAARFNVSPDAFLLIDDNIGELAEASARFPDVRLLHAGPTAEAAARALRGFPGLPRGVASFAGRAADLVANAERAALARDTADEEAYLRALKAELQFSLDPKAERGRLAEISRKTNQFNLALARLDEVAVDGYLQRPDRCVVHVRLRDRLADSGSVAAMFARREDDGMVVDELCISCRALGRSLEDVMVGEALRRAREALSVRRVSFSYRRGPRNAPALTWLARYTGQEPGGEAGQVVVAELPYRKPASVSISWSN